MSPHETKNKQALICKDKSKKKLMGKAAHDKWTSRIRKAKKDEIKMPKSLDFNTQSVKKEIPHSEGFIA